MAKNEIIYESRRKGKEARLPIVAELYSKGKSYSKIREEVMARLGLSSYSKATVKKDIDTLLEEWRESRIKDIDLAQTLALERNRQHYEEVREEWERSKEDRTAKSVKRKGFPTKSGEDDEEVPSFDYDTVEIIGKPTYSKVVSAVVRDKYTADKEIALINNYNRYQLATTANKVAADKEEYVAYLDEVEAIKAMVKRDCISYNFEIDG